MKAQGIAQADDLITKTWLCLEIVSGSKKTKEADFKIPLTPFVKGGNGRSEALKGKTEGMKPIDFGNG